MSFPNQHQSSLTISQNEDNKKPKIEINCSSQSIHANSIELLNSNKLDESLDINNKSDKIDQNKQIENSTNEQINDEKLIKQIDNEQINTVQIENEQIDKIDYNEKIINNEEIVISTNTDEQVIQCEIAFNSQEEQLLANRDKELQNTSVLVIDESKDQLIKTDDDLLNNQIENNKSSNTENSDLNLNKLESNSENEYENKSCSTLNQQENQLNIEENQVKLLNKLSEDYLLNSSTITSNNKPTLNNQHVQLNQFNSAANKRKLDLPQQLLKFVTSRKSARLHESQSYHSDNSIYLFESLRKRSSSISSTNSLNSDLARSTAKSTNEIFHKPASINSTSIKLSKRRCANLDDPVMDCEKMDDCTAALVLMSLSYSPKSALLKDKIKKLIKKEVSAEHQMPIKSQNRIAMLPKQRFKQEQRLMLLNSNTYQSKIKPNSTNKSNSSSQSIEEGFNEEFISYSDEDDELLILQQDVNLDDNVKPLSLKKQTKSSSPDKMKCNTILLKPATRMVFQCTWRNCGHECDVREEIEEHVRIKHLGITFCTDDHEEDFYYTEVELDSPLDSSGVSSASNVSPLHEPTNNKNMSTKTNTSITQFTNQEILKQSRKRGPKPRQKNIVIDSSNNLNKFNSTWMHMDMARPPHEDPEYKSRLLNNDNNTNIIAKRERKRAASNDYASDQSDLELNRQQQLQQHQYIQNLTREQLVKLQQQNDLHLKNNIQHLQQLQRQHHQLHQLHQLHQYNQLKRKYTKSQPSITNSSSNSILMPTTRTKSVICSMAQLENDLDHRLLNSTNQHSSNLLKRSKPIKIPGISLAHRDYHQNPNPSPSFTVGSVQLSPTSYFHCFSPTPPHSLSSPTSSNSSMYSLGSCNSPGSSSIASSSSTGGSLNSYSPNSINSSQSILNRNSAHYSPIDTLLQTVENERMQQLAMEDEAINLINNGKKISKLKSANVSDLDLDLVAQNEDDKFDNQDEIVKSSLITNNENEKNNELVNQTLKTIKCTNNSQIITNNNNIKVINDNSIKKITNAVNNCNSVIKNGQIALLQDSVAKNSLTVDCDLILDNLKNKNRIDLQTKQQQLVQTAQQALVTLASTASNLCKNTTVTIQSPNKVSQSSNDNSNLTNEKSNSIQNNSKVEKKDLSTSKSVNQSKQNNGLLMAASNITQQPKTNDNEQLNQQQSKPQPFNYLVSHSGRTIKPTAAAKSYVQRKHRLNTKYMRTHNSPTNSAASSVNKKQSSINKTKMNNSNLMQFERLLEAAQSNSNYNQNKNINDLNMVRNTIISSVGNLNNNNNSSNNTINNHHTTSEIQQQQVQIQVQQQQQQPDTQRTPTGRIRNTGAKCRKRFGMENKHQWCVSCRWKKRCSRVVDSNSGLTNLTEYNNQAVATNTTERVGRGRPGRSANTSSNNSDQIRRANVTPTISSTRADNHSQRNNIISANATGSDFSAMAEELLRTGTLLNNQRTIVTAK